MAVDLHTHTTYSDGTLTPQQLVIHACERKLTALAVTDHDITSGNDEAMYYGKKYGIDIVPGVELSIDCTLPNSGHMHILGLLIDFNDDILNRTLDFLRAEREKRNHKIAAILAGMNMSISVAEIEQEAGEGSAGRPHIARLIVQKGYATSLQEAFDRFLKKGAPAYVKKVKLDEQEAIKLIHDANGLSILAHPSTLQYDAKQQLADKILQLKYLGLDGIEVYSSFHRQELTTWLEEFAQQHDMVISGGSDFHGTNKQEIQIGSGKGNLKIPDRVYQQLQNYKNHKKEKNGD